MGAINPTTKKSIMISNIESVCASTLDIKLDISIEPRVKRYDSKAEYTKIIKTVIIRG